MWVLVNQKICTPKTTIWIPVSVPFGCAGCQVWIFPQIFLVSQCFELFHGCILVCLGGYEITDSAYLERYGGPVFSVKKVTKSWHLEMEIEPNPVKVLGVQIFWLTKTHILAPPSSSSVLLLHGYMYYRYCYYYLLLLLILLHLLQYYTYNCYYSCSCCLLVAAAHYGIVGTARKRLF